MPKPPRTSAQPALAEITITITQLEDAINRARTRTPSTGNESSLSADVAALGAVYGRLIFRNGLTVEVATLSERERDALGRWVRTPV